MSDSVEPAARRSGYAAGRIPALAALMAVAFALLSACAGPGRVLTEVSRFHDLGAPADRPITFSVEAGPDTDDRSLAFDTYANLVAAQLSRHGFRRVPSGGEAVVRLAYGIDNGRDLVQSSPGYFTGRPRVVHYVDRRGGVVATHLVPSWEFVPGYAYSVTVFRRRVDLSILRAGSENDAAGTRPIFEAQAVSEGASGQLNRVMPQMIAAIFEGFPGRSGETYRVTLPLEPLPDAKPADAPVGPPDADAPTASPSEGAKP